MPFDLPAGLSPVAAARMGLWLLGLREHRKSLRRVGVPPRATKGDALSRFLWLTVPWRVYEYPGSERLLSALFGISRKSAKSYMGHPKQLPRVHALRLAQMCADRELAYREVRLALEAHAAGKRERGGRPDLVREDRGG